MKYLRLKKQTDFQKLFQKGKRAYSASVTMVFRASDKTYMGVSVGKKHGKSVQRNRIKRLIREAFRSAVSDMNGTYSVVFVPKVLEEYSFHTFERDIRWMIKKEKM